MKKSLIIMLLLALVSIATYAKGGKSSSFGKWNYDKFPEGKQVIKGANAPSGYNLSDPCYKFIHVNTKFHVRVKNWTPWLHFGRSGYAEMKATLGTATSSCNIPYKDIAFHLFYDHTVKRTNGADYVRVTMKGVGALNECYKALGFAITKNGMVLPNGYRESLGDITKKAVLNEEKGCYKISKEDLFHISF